MHGARGQILLGLGQTSFIEVTAKLVEPHQNGALCRIAHMALDPEHSGEADAACDGLHAV
jgi:hypothetical protein